MVNCECDLSWHGNRSTVAPVSNIGAPLKPFWNGAGINSKFFKLTNGGANRCGSGLLANLSVVFIGGATYHEVSRLTKHNFRHLVAPAHIESEPIHVAEVCPW